MASLRASVRRSVSVNSALCTFHSVWPRFHAPVVSSHDVLEECTYLCAIKCSIVHYDVIRIAVIVKLFYLMPALITRVHLLINIFIEMTENL